MSQERQKLELEEIRKQFGDEALIPLLNLYDSVLRRVEVAAEPPAGHPDNEVYRWVKAALDEGEKIIQKVHGPKDKQTP